MGGINPGILNASANLMVACIFWILWRVDRTSWNRYWAVFNLLVVVIGLLLSFGEPYSVLWVRIALAPTVGAMLASLFAGVSQFHARPLEPRRSFIIGMAGALALAILADAFDTGAAIPVLVGLASLGLIGAGAILASRREPVPLAVGILFVLRGANALLYIPKATVNIAFINGFVLVVATGFALVLLSFLEGRHRLVALAGQLSEANDQLRERETSLIEANEMLARLTVDLERRTVENASARDRAESANRAKTQFLSNASHELRTPLNAILGFCELMMSLDTWSLAKLRESIGLIYEAGQRLRQTIDDVLNFSEIDMDAVVPRPEQAPLHQLAETALNIVKAKAVEKKLTIVQDIPTDLVLDVDPSLMVQVLIHTIGAAVRFAPASGKLAIIAEQAMNRARIHVADIGPAMAEADRERLFDPFHQDRDAWIAGPNGLGIALSIAARLVHVQGGDITAVPSDGGGTAVLIDMPAAQSHLGLSLAG
jgi:signal transduction histidine kinase